MVERKKLRKMKTALVSRLQGFISRNAINPDDDTNILLFHPFEIITDTASSQATANKNGESLPIQSTRSFLFLFRKHSQFCMF